MPDSLDVCCVLLHKEQTDLCFLGALKEGACLTPSVLRQAVPEASWYLQEISNLEQVFL